MNDQKKILYVVDSDPEIRAMIKVLLAKQYHVMSFENPTLALKMATEIPPYVILLDLHMPNIDGFEMLRMLKEHPFTYDIPVICTGADEAEGVRERIHEYGGLGFIQKPFETNLLFRSIEGFVGSVFSHIKDKTGRFNYYIHYNHREKEDLLNSIFEKSTGAETPIYLISWKKGEHYQENQLVQDLINKEKLIFLEVKNTLPTRFPYLQDLSPVFNDLEQFFHIPPRNSHIIIDEIKFLIPGKQYLMEEKIITFIDFLKRDFKEVTILNTNSRQKEINVFLQQIAREFINL